jgi:hypothetical protein
MEEDINKKIINLWTENTQKYPEATKFWPLLIPELKENSILFIGINPGFKDSYFEKFGVSQKDFLFSNKNFDIKQEIERESKAKLQGSIEHYATYFNPFEKIAQEVGEKWEHIDLFFIRDTSQNKLRELVDYEAIDESVILNDFASKQLDLSLSLLQKIKPKAIIVQNALASKILASKISIDASEFDNRGYDFINLNNRKVPIFFSGMLSGPHSLDSGSFRRLVWQIKQALRDKVL